MKSILEFLGEFEEFEILKFDEDMIFNKPIEVWLESFWLDVSHRSGTGAISSLASTQIGSP